ncbi:MAG: RluA family pseudouridine synthase [Clostridia bacterium]|nr:RluA family pseudouridine synthase [Clostridia bacterium]
MAEILTLTADEKGERIDKFISSSCEALTRSHVQKLIEEGRVSVNGKNVKANYKMCCGDVVCVTVPEPQMLEAKPEDIELDIVYEDDWLLVVNKPQGMVVHPAAGNFEGTLVNALLSHCDGNLSEINGVIRPGIVHRIDKDTSGLLLVAKNNEAHLSLAEQIKEHSVNRRYLAVTIGVIKEDEGTVNAPIGRNPNDRKKMAISYKNSKEAITHYFVKERYNGYTLIECKLETGRTHQIRVHMTSLGRPLLGDKVYGPEKQKFSLEGQMLHAYKIGFVHPKTGEYMEFSKEPPEYFKKTLKILEEKSKKV